MQKLIALSLSLLGLVGGTAAHAATGHTAKGFIVAAIKQAPDVVNKNGKFKTKLGGKPGDKVRPYTADNIHHQIFPFVGPGGQAGGARLAVGATYAGHINMKTNRVTVKTVAVPRRLPL